MNDRGVYLLFLVVVVGGFTIGALMFRRPWWYAVGVAVAAYAVLLVAYLLAVRYVA